MSRWYSPRGARRGLWLAALAAALWLAWAGAYLYGYPHDAQAYVVIAPESAVLRAGVEACQCVDQTLSRGDARSIDVGLTVAF